MDSVRQIRLFEPDGAPSPPPRPRRQLSSGASFEILVLGSGSSGNCVVVRAADSTLLIDAGFSCREIERRLKRVGVDPARLDGVVVTHEHGDHCKGVALISRRHELPVFATAGTFLGRAFRKVERRHVVRARQPFEVGSFEIEGFGVPHDAREPVGFAIFGNCGGKAGVVADLGALRGRARDSLRGSSVLVIESNHDLDMLRRGPYPWSLKRRVASDRGHLSNVDAAAAVVDLVDADLETVVLYHLSRTNNLPGLAHMAMSESLDGLGARVDVVLSHQDSPTGWVEVRS